MKKAGSSGGVGDAGNASSDDDDFWGMGGSSLGPKPTLGASGGQVSKGIGGGSTGNQDAKGGGFGGSALDDWLL